VFCASEYQLPPAENINITPEERILASCLSTIPGIKTITSHTPLHDIASASTRFSKM